MTLYLQRIKFTNVRGFRSFDLDFGSPARRRMWTILIGDNGHGKTTVLRAIAIGLADEKTASELLSQLPGEFIRQNKKGVPEDEASIELTLYDLDGSPPVVLRTIVRRDESGELTVRKTLPPGFRFEQLFVCAYGSNRGTGSRTHSSYAMRNSLVTLFNDRAGVLDPESVLRDFKLLSTESASSSADPFEAVSALLWKFWKMHQNHRLDVTAKSITVHGQWGGIPFHALGDGYRGTGTWLLDLLGNALKAGLWDHPNEELRGIVLLDEMEEHLHPRWQKRLVPTLRRLLPNLQFITTTHSPLAIVNTQPGELVGVRIHNTVAQRLDLLFPPTEGKTANEILQGEWFGLESVLDSKTEATLQKFKKALRDGKAGRADKLADDLRRRVPTFVTSPVDPLAQEIADTMRQQFVASTSATERATLLRQAADELRKRVEGLSK